MLAAGHRLKVLCLDAATADRLDQMLAQLAGPHLDSRLATPICDLCDRTSVDRCAEDLLRVGEQGQPQGSRFRNQSFFRSAQRSDSSGSWTGDPCLWAVSQHRIMALFGQEFGIDKSLFLFNCRHTAEDRLFR